MPGAWIWAWGNLLYVKYTRSKAHFVALTDWIAKEIRQYKDFGADLMEVVASVVSLHRFVGEDMAKAVHGKASRTDWQT
jgi:hypothetical protein